VADEKIRVIGEDRASAAFKKAETSFEKLSSSVKTAATIGGLAIGAAKLIQFATGTVRLAIDAEEAAAAFNTTFGPAVNRATRFVEGFANMAGFTAGELQQLLAITGNVVQGIGATADESADLAVRMATLAGDVASFSNAAGGAKSVLLALQSAINGEREALKTYGLAISEVEVQQAALDATNKKSVDDLSRLDKALATVELAYAKAGHAVGDLERTQDSAANSLRRANAVWKEAQTELGTKLVPALEAILPAVIALIEPVGGLLGTAFTILGTAVKVVAPLLSIIADALSMLPGPAQLAAVAFLILAVRTGGLVKAYDLLDFKLRALRTRGIPGLRNALTGLSASTVAATVAVAGIVTVLAIWSRENAENKARVEELQATLDETTVAVTANTYEWVRNTLAKDDDLATLNALGITVEEFTDALGGEKDARAALRAQIDEGVRLGIIEISQAQDLHRKINEVNRAKRLAVDAQDTLNDSRRASEATTRGAAIAEGILEDQLAMLAAESGVTADALSLLSDEERAAALEADRAASAASNLAGYHAALEDRTRTLAGALDLARQKQQSLTDVMLAAADPIFGAVDALTEYHETLARIDDDSKRTAEEQFELARAALRVAGAFESLDPATTENALASIGVALGLTRQGVVDLLAQFGIFVDEAGNISQDIADGLLSGMDGLANRFANRVIGELDTGLAQVQDKYQISSPSKVFAEKVGRPIAEGIAEGINRFAGAVPLALSGAIGFSPGVDTSSSGAGASFSGASFNGSRPVTINVVLDRRMLAQAVLPELADEIEVVVGNYR